MKTIAAVAALLALMALAAATLPQADATAQQGLSIGVDADPSGNEATSLGDIDQCVSVNKDDTFQVDVFVTDVSDLKAWEAYFSFDGSIVNVTDRDVELFQTANPDSDVFDASESLPSSGGLYRLGGIDFGRADSGSGVLARLTLKAVGAGISPAIVLTLDADNDGKPDLGTRLKDPQETPIGDANGDEIFDSTIYNAQIAVDRDCPASPAQTAIPSPTASPTAGDQETTSPAPTDTAAATVSASPTPRPSATLGPGVASPTPGGSSPAEDEGTDWGSPGFIAAYVAVGAVAMLAAGGLAFFGTRKRRA